MTSLAESDRERRINEGKTYELEQLAAAKGQAVATVNRAEADREGRLARASGESDAFLNQLSARATHPALTDHRLYWEAIASALAGKSKVVLDPDEAQRRHLVVSDFPLGEAPPALNAAIGSTPR